jgi:hypothetical protein
LASPAGDFVFVPEPDFRRFLGLRSGQRDELVFESIAILEREKESQQSNGSLTDVGDPKSFDSDRAAHANA